VTTRQNSPGVISGKSIVTSCLAWRRAAAAGRLTNVRAREDKARADQEANAAGSARSPDGYSRTRGQSPGQPVRPSDPPLTTLAHEEFMIPAKQATARPARLYADSYIPVVLHRPSALSIR